MKNTIKNFLLIGLLGLTSCKVETPFGGQTESGTGEFSKSALNFDVAAIDDLNSRAININELIDDFTIVFQTVSSTPITKATYTYKNMPEVITLEAGTYTITATYGENRDAAFEEPHYIGKSDEFTISANKITTNIGPIKCKLENIKVSVKFHWSLADHMSDDSYVEVSVNKVEPLQFTKSHADNEIAGYFKHAEETTLTATFHGTVDGVLLNEVKTMANVTKGNHYVLTFSRNNYDGDETGNLGGGISVNTTVTVVDLNGGSVLIEDDPVLDDNERPREDDPNEGDEDQAGKEDPVDPTPGEEKKAPTIIVVPNPSTGVCDIDLSKENEITKDDYIVLKITSTAEDGIEKFDVHIDMEGIDLSTVNLSNDLDLVNPDSSYLAQVQGLGLLDDKDGNKLTTLKGVKEQTFSILGLMDLLMIAKGHHEFTITVGDANGTTTNKMILIVK